MLTYVFDIESDNLLLEATKMHVLCVKNIETGAMHSWLEGDRGWEYTLNKADMLIGHNITGFDLPLLKKLFNWSPPKKCKIRDTLVMSLVLNYRRFGFDSHSLDAWGVYLGDHKIGFDDYSKYTAEMQLYVEQDVNLNHKVYQQLEKELFVEAERNPQITAYLQAEQYSAKWSAEAHLTGWLFDKAAGEKLYKALGDLLADVTGKLEHKLGLKTVAKDMVKGVVDIKRPKWTKAGTYNHHTAAWFGIDPYEGLEEFSRPILGEYCRVEIVPLKLSSPHDVKIFLYRQGWVPSEWNWKKEEDSYKKKRTSPKITDDSLILLGGDGDLYVDYRSASSRHSILKTWLGALDSDSKLHGDCYNIGTPSMRARHKIIANIPGSDAPWGKEFRQLFTCPEGYTLVGADSSSCQARGLAHYLGDEGYIKTLLEGDAHQANADILTAELKKLGKDRVVTRSQAKRVLYAHLFGAAGATLWSYIFGVGDDKLGDKLKKGFTKAIPGFDRLLKVLDAEFKSSRSTGWGYVTSLAGNRVFVDSKHKLLVYLLQAAEKVTVTGSLMLFMKELDAKGIWYEPKILYHDEWDVMVKKEDAELVAEIAHHSFINGPKLFGVEIMDGESKIGNTWYEIH